MKSLKELRNNKLKLSSTGLFFSKIKDLKKKNLDFNVFLPTLGINLQREQVWNNRQKSELILSILFERYIPNICIFSLIDYSKKNANVGDDIIQVIDGKQRLTTMIDFIENKFFVIIEGEAFLFKNLPEEYQFYINHFSILSQVCYDNFGEEVTDEQKINWFKMINFSGTVQDEQHLQNLEFKISK